MKLSISIAFSVTSAVYINLLGELPKCSNIHKVDKGSFFVSQSQLFTLNLFANAAYLTSSLLLSSQSFKQLSKVT